MPPRKPGQDDRSGRQRLWSAFDMHDGSTTGKTGTKVERKEPLGSITILTSYEL